MGYFINLFRCLCCTPTSQYTPSTPTSVVWVFSVIVMGTGMLSLRTLPFLYSHVEFTKSHLSIDSVYTMILVARTKNAFQSS